MPVSSYQPLDGALERLSFYGPGLANGNFNHAPMVAEALCAMGRPEAVMPWVERYQGRLVMPYDQARILARNDRPETMPVLSSCRPSAEPRRGAAMAAKAN